MAVKVRPYKRRGVVQRGRWQVDVTVKLPTGGDAYREQFASRDFQTKAKARAWGEQREAAAKQLAAAGKGVRTIFLALRGQGEAERAQVPTLAEYETPFMIFSRIHNKPSTLFAKEWMLRTHLVPFFGEMRLDEIGPAKIDEYKAAKLDEGQNRKSINNHLAALRKLLNLAAERDVIVKAPKVKAFSLARNDRVEDDEYLTFEETERFLRAAAPEWRTFLVVALKTGLRVGELLALRWEDLDLVAAKLDVRRTLWNGQEGTPKGGRNRTVFLSGEAAAALKAHRHLRGPHVFCDAAGTRLTHSEVKDVVPRTCKKAGLSKRITTHGLRHTFASHLVMRGVSLKAVQELLGHATIEMTMRYAHLAPSVKRDAVRLLDVPAPAAPDGRENRTAGVPVGGA